MRHLLEGVVLPFFGGEPLGRKCRQLVLVLTFRLLDSRTGTGDGCLFLLEPRASDSKASKIWEIPAKHLRCRHQPAPVTPVDVLKEQLQEEGPGGEWDEERRKSASPGFGPPVPGVAMKAFQRALCLMLLCVR